MHALLTGRNAIAGTLVRGVLIGSSQVGLRATTQVFGTACAHSDGPSTIPILHPRRVRSAFREPEYRKERAEYFLCAKSNFRGVTQLRIARRGSLLKGRVRSRGTAARAHRNGPKSSRGRSPAWPFLVMTQVDRRRRVGPAASHWLGLGRIWLEAAKD